MGGASRRTGGQQRQSCEQRGPQVSEHGGLLRPASLVPLEKSGRESNGRAGSERDLRSFGVRCWRLRAFCIAFFADRQGTARPAAPPRHSAEHSHNRRPNFRNSRKSVEIPAGSRNYPRHRRFFRATVALRGLIGSIVSALIVFEG